MIICALWGGFPKVFTGISRYKYQIYNSIRKECQDGNGRRDHGTKIMEDNRNEQVEALEVLTEFNERLVKNLKIVIKELSGARLDDTDNFIKSIIDAMNWEIQVMNGTMSLLNEGKQRIDKESFNKSAVAVGEAVAAKDDAKLAEAFEAILPYFVTLGEAAAEVIQ